MAASACSRRSSQGEDRGGKLLYLRKVASNGRVIEPAYVAMMNAMMQETLLTGTARQASLPGWQAAGKTGTSQDFRDAWFIGYTSHLVTGVWLGNDDNSPTKKTSGGSLPVEIWSRFMRAAHQGVPPQPLPGGIWQGNTAVADENGWPLPSFFSGGPFASRHATSRRRPIRRTMVCLSAMMPAQLRQPMAAGWCRQRIFPMAGDRDKGAGRKVDQRTFSSSCLGDNIAQRHPHLRRPERPSRRMSHAALEMPSPFEPC